MAASVSRTGAAKGSRYRTRSRRRSAREYFAAIQEFENAHGGLLAKRLRERAKRPGGVRAALAPGETCDAWYERFAAYRRAEVGSVDPLCARRGDRSFEPRDVDRVDPRLVADRASDLR
jgi:hypothetical protein